MTSEEKVPRDDPSLKVVGGDDHTDNNGRAEVTASIFGASLNVKGAAWLLALIAALATIAYIFGPRGESKHDPNNIDNRTLPDSSGDGVSPVVPETRSAST